MKKVEWIRCKDCGEEPLRLAVVRKVFPCELEDLACPCDGKSGFEVVEREVPEDEVVEVRS